MTFVSYAQNFEDVILWRALCDAEPKSYLDIGAQDPTNDSVSRAFYEAGWRGTHVEPIPFYVAKLRDARPEETVIEAAVSQAPGPLEFHEIPNTGLSTGKPEIARKHVERGYHARSILVPTLGLDRLLGRTGEIPWMKIDVEGMEADVLASWGDSAIRPWIVVVEATIPMEQARTDHLWCSELASRDYQEVYFDGLSRYYLHRNHLGLAERFSAPPNVFDAFGVSRTHFVARELATDFDEDMRKAEALQLETERRHSEQLSSRDELVRQHRQEAEAAVSQARELLAGLAAAEADHRASVERMWAERVQAEAEIRAQGLGVERSLRDELSAVLARLSDERRQVAKLQERDSQRALQVKQAKAETQSVRRSLAKELAEFRDQTEAERVTIQQQNESERAGLQKEIAEVRERLAAANAVIEKALAEPVGRWQRLARAVGVAGKDRVRQALRSWEAHNPTSNDRPVEPAMSIAPLVVTGDHLQAGSLAELLSFDGRKFVRATYATILGRESDPEGEAYYLDRLEGGVPKIQIVDEISRSPEAKLLPDPLPELKSQLRRFRITSLYLGKQKAGFAIENNIASQSKGPHVREFMRYHDEEFVKVVYQYYLEREADPHGLENYVKLIRSGVSRQKILLDVANSEESRKIGRSSNGQRRLAAALLIEGIPIIGQLFAAIRFNLLIQQHLRDMRAMQNHLYRLTQRVS